jgi:hypothetical protein
MEFCLPGPGRFSRGALGIQDGGPYRQRQEEANGASTFSMAKAGSCQGIPALPVEEVGTSPFPQQEPAPEFRKAGPLW